VQKYRNQIKHNLYLRINSIFEVLNLFMKKYIIIFLLLPIISFSQFTTKKIYNIKKIKPYKDTVVVSGITINHKKPIYKSPKIDGILNDEV